MKTDIVEIFQTLRAFLQPYATRGYNVHNNSETEYDLWSEKNMIDGGQEVTERFFAGLAIADHGVIVKINFKKDDEVFEQASTIEVEHLDQEKLKEIENLIAITHDYFKEKHWI